MALARKMIIPILTKEQEEELKTYCLVNNWEFEISESVNADNVPTVVKKRKQNPKPPKDVQWTPKKKDHRKKQVAACIHNHTLDYKLSSVCEEKNTTETFPDECPHCYCVPCITTYPQAWLGEGQPPRAGNNEIGRASCRERV